MNAICGRRCNLLGICSIPDDPQPDSLLADRVIQPMAMEPFTQRIERSRRGCMTDEPRSYRVTLRPLLPKVEHRQSRDLNDRAKKFTSFNTPARASDTTTQIARTGPRLSLASRVYPRPLLSSTTLMTSNSDRAIPTEAFNVSQHGTCVWGVA